MYIPIFITYIDITLKQQRNADTKMKLHNSKNIDWSNPTLMDMTGMLAGFAKELDKSTPDDMDINLVVDCNGGATIEKVTVSAFLNCNAIARVRVASLYLVMDSSDNYNMGIDIGKSDILDIESMRLFSEVIQSMVVCVESIEFLKNKAIES